MPETFKERHREMQEFVRELKWLRDHNLKFGPKDPQTELLLFAEAAITLVALERFVRIVLGTEALDTDTLPNLLEKATGERLHLLSLPFPDRERAIKQIKDVRNTLLHANYEQAAAQAGLTSAKDYFKKMFACDIEALYKLLEHLMEQIDIRTGRPVRAADSQ